MMVPHRSGSPACPPKRFPLVSCPPSPLLSSILEETKTNQGKFETREGARRSPSSNGGVVRGGGGAAAAPRDGGDGGGRAALRGADLGGRHDRPRRRLVLAPALDGAALPRLPQPPPHPLGAAGLRCAAPLARLHRALRLLRRAEPPLLRLPTLQRQAPGQGRPRGSRGQWCRSLRRWQVRM
jgi:hypothetical protein